MRASFRILGCDGDQYSLDSRGVEPRAYQILVHLPLRRGWFDFLEDVAMSGIVEVDRREERLEKPLNGEEGNLSMHVAAQFGSILFQVGYSVGGVRVGSVEAGWRVALSNKGFSKADGAGGHGNGEDDERYVEGEEVGRGTGRPVGWGIDGVVEAGANEQRTYQRKGFVLQNRYSSTNMEMV